ncbi:type II secretion system protein GspM [Chromatocurvus halotolerans]|uniref:Type II secretion system protein M n=1 Tax=Chromatocurvus halotolerans TaxID=1132028 RepID=A0A4R2KTQ0_9GAMM|nr:type II secretion system protein M [Chromatocurvus halotolerans]TCO76157.1 type II secretory pathway component PulM [Chromatocurvus halotolerans]
MIRQWFSRFTGREQVSLLALAAALAVFVAYHLIWSPVAAARDEMVRRNLASAESLQRVSAMVSEIAQRRESGDSPAQGRSITALVNQSSLEQGLTVTRLQPNSRGEVQVRFEAAAFDALMRWLYQLESGEGALVTELSLSESGTPGRVNATVRVAGGG